MIIFQVSEEGDWCRATLDDKEGTKVLYDGHCTPDTLVYDVLKGLGVKYKYVISDEGL